MNNTTITVVGNIATDPHRRETPSGSVTSFRLASTDRRLDRGTGQWVNAETSFFTVSSWWRLGERVFDDLKKGDPVVVVGRLKIREWTKDDRSGITADITADVVGPDLRRVGATVARSPRPAVPPTVPASQPMTEPMTEPMSESAA